MIRILFNIKRLEVKLFISIIIMVIYFILYKTLPPSEIGKEKVSNFDLFYYALLNQMGIHHSAYFEPKSIRARVIILSHLVLGYLILLA